MQRKTFIIRSKEGFKEMPVLISAAAVQLTFGLDGFLLPWFDSIQIHDEQYFEEDSLKVLNGDVDGKTITVAWNELLKGNSDEADGENVALHEMAHALYYQKIIVETTDTNFNAVFAEVMRQGGEIFSMPIQQHFLFGNYAYKNMQEFWAESVEVFFEQPVQMEITYNNFFTLLAKLLNQDPRNRANPILNHN